MFKKPVDPVGILKTTRPLLRITSSLMVGCSGTVRDDPAPSKDPRNGGRSPS
jgi:hypothetical protein